MPICCIVGCGNRPGRDAGIRFFNIPAVITRECEKTAALSTRRRALWLSRINRKKLSDNDVRQHTRIYSRHFISGQPSKLFDDTNPDWAPSIALGYPKSACGIQLAVKAVERYERIKGRTTAKFVRSVQGVCDSQDVHLPRGDNECETTSEVEFIGDESGATASDFQLCVSTSAEEDSHNKQCQINMQTSDADCQATPMSAEFSCQASVSWNETVCQTDLTSEQIDDTVHQLNCALDDNTALRADICSVSDRLKAQSLSEDVLREDDEKVKFYTGLPSFVLLHHVFMLIEKSVPYNANNALPKFQEFVICLMKLRLNAPLQDLAYRFGVHCSTVSRIFEKWLFALSYGLENVITWPDRKTLQTTMPLSFQQKFGKSVAVIVDCFEVFIERPSSLLPRSGTLSQYKHHNTVKILIGITPQGTISFVSKAWVGRTSDVYLTEHCGILDQLLPGDIILADRGFTIGDSVAFRCAKLHIPAFTKGKPQLSFNDIEETRKLANLRIHVERVIGVVRQKYMILSGTLPISYMRCKQNDPLATVDHIVRVCCALTNLCPPIVAIE